ncbi:MAG: hypothetical protein OXK75_06685 [Gammaproteobacteria bacterium]|nr:hypothetical protein [Gammaproteobacteria bacterium]
MAQRNLPSDRPSALRRPLRLCGLDAPVNAWVPVDRHPVHRPRPVAQSAGLGLLASGSGWYVTVVRPSSIW